MKNLLLIFLFAFSISASSQAVGDTIRVQAFNYDSITRDTILQFPDNPALTFEKILLKYNMRCKNATVLNGPEDGVTGCGEWDYSCNTFIADSTKVEKVLTPWPDYQISNFTGTAFDYTTQQTFDHYDFVTNQIVLNSVISETATTIGSGSEVLANILRTSQKSGRSQMLITAAQLQAAGFSAGALHGMGLNVTNAGGLVKFLKVSIKPTAITSLNTQALNFDGFSNVFFSDFTFTTGVNRLQFHTPFNWDGTSGIIIELSFSNTATFADIEFQGFAASALQSVTAANIGAVDVSASGEVDIKTDFFNTINNELTVSFWTMGNAELLPSDNSIVYGYSDNVAQRQLNLHLPWGGSVYFDCGYSGNGFDRIEKPYGTDNVIEGVWNHWAFTKNAISGDMKIFLNGALWHSGVDKTRAISLVKFFLGKFTDGNDNRYYKGKIRELSVWDKALAESTILQWKNKQLNTSHPDYSNLVAYYKLDEMQGQQATDSRHGLISDGVNLNWTYERGDQLTTTFTESNLLPNVVLYRGVYDQDSNVQTIRYSYPRSARSVKHYSVTSNEGAIPMADDVLNLVSTQFLFDAAPENIYNGETGELVGTLPVTAEGTINVTPLQYFKRYPFYNELVSFVTPYGIGLDLGANGKTWYFDMSDYVSLLKGAKQLVMSGGIWQEELDLEFLFIVGTPPRNVVQYEQLWQGQYRIGSPNIAEINNGSKYPTNTFQFSSEAASFKLKSSITGHGAEGEFSQNGGTIQHRIFGDNIQRLSWTITQDCSENPIFPQGGTWVYNRQGWCPGQRTLMKENEITSFAAPGSTVALDYRTSNPTVASGDYRYISSHQVVGYGAPNFANDAAVENVKAPNNFNAEYSRINPMCEQPRITLRNTGANALTSVNFEYWINDADEHQEFTWTGNLASMVAVDVLLPVANLWDSGLAEGDNRFHVQISSINSGADGYSNNNHYASTFTLPDIVPDVFKIRFKTNNNPAQNSYTLYDDSGNVIDTKTFPAANTIYTFTYQSPQIAPGCYHLRVNDSGKNGLQWWATPAQGAGYVRILNASDVMIKNFNPDFGGGFDYSFSVNSLLATEIFGQNNLLKVYPNPARGSFSVESVNLPGAKVMVVDMLGKEVAAAIAESEILNFDTAQLQAGLYLIKVEKNGKSEIVKLVIY